MIAPTDKEYKLTKLIKQGKTTMDSEFVSIGKWIDKNYNVKTINIIYDTIDNGERPRLQIIFETNDDAEKFRTKSGYDILKQQEVAKEFKNTLIAKRLNPNEYKSENILIIFSAFEPIAKLEASWNIPESEIQKLQTELNIKDLWKIHQETFNEPTFFFYTDEQVTEYSVNGMKDFLAEKYFNLLKSVDEFGYIKKEQFQINLDSKENFDATYSGNWFYYDRR